MLKAQAKVEQAIRTKIEPTFVKEPVERIQVVQGCTNPNSCVCEVHNINKIVGVRPQPSHPVRVYKNVARSTAEKNYRRLFPVVKVVGVKAVFQ